MFATDQLVVSSAKGDLPSVSASLDGDPYLLNRIAPHPYWGGSATALHLAAEFGRDEILEHLLAGGSNPNPDSAA